MSWAAQVASHTIVKMNRPVNTVLNSEVPLHVAGWTFWGAMYHLGAFGGAIVQLLGFAWMGKYETLGLAMVVMMIAVVIYLKMLKLEARAIAPPVMTEVSEETGSQKADCGGCLRTSLNARKPWQSRFRKCRVEVKSWSSKQRSCERRSTGGKSCYECTTVWTIPPRTSIVSGTGYGMATWPTKPCRDQLRATSF